MDVRVIVTGKGSIAFRSRFLDFTGGVLHCQMMNQAIAVVAA